MFNMYMPIVCPVLNRSKRDGRCACSRSGRVPKWSEAQSKDDTLPKIESYPALAPAQQLDVIRAATADDAAARASPEKV